MYIELGKTGLRIVNKFRHHGDHVTGHSYLKGYHDEEAMSQQEKTIPNCIPL